MAPKSEMKYLFTHHMNLVVVELAQHSDVIFNCIDHGSYFDFAVMSLCVSLEIPYITGSSYSHNALVEFFPGKGGPCWGCHNMPDDIAILHALVPSKVEIWRCCCARDQLLS